MTSTPVENKALKPRNNKESITARALTKHMPAFKEMFVLLPNKNKPYPNIVSQEDKDILGDFCLDHSKMEVVLQNC